MSEHETDPVQPAPEDQRRRRVPLWVYFLTGGVALAVVLSLVGAAIILRGDEKKATNAADEKLQVLEYETPSDPGDEPFTTAADVEGSEVVRFTPVSGTTDTTEPFGGSGSLHVCDREKLVDFLTTHPSQRREWSRVLSIDPDPDAVARYVRSLTPVTLTVDTRVTNHNYVHGKAVPFQSILAAGTAVLVDKYGRPVVRCKCGNPLLEPVDYPRIRCKGCPPHYKPPKLCKWRIYDPWYPYPPEYLPPEWRDPYPKNYSKPKPWVYKQGKYCYVLYPEPPDIEYPPRWYPPPTYTPPPKYYPQPQYSPPAHDDDDDDGDYTEPAEDEDDDSDSGCCGDDGDSEEPEHSDDMMQHDY